MTVKRRSVWKGKSGPFCGAPAYVDGHGDDYRFVNCQNIECDAQGPHAETEEEAINAWNERIK